MRFRRGAIFGSIAVCGLVVACLPDLITDPLPDAGVELQIGAYCGDGYITLGEYDGGFADLDAGEQCDPSEGGTIGCTRDCRVDCDGGFVDPIDNHCYFPMQSVTSLDQENCETFGAHAITFLDDRERAFVRAKFGEALTFWVNLSFSSDPNAYVPAAPNSEEEPGWSPSCSGCYVPNGTDASTLLNDAGDGTCIVDRGKLGWSQVPCTRNPTPIAVLCEREPPGSLAVPCTGGTCLSVPQTAGKKRYLFSPVAVTSDSAVAACAELGGSLVVFDSPEERETLLRELVRSAAAHAALTEAWIGLSTPDVDASWTWDDDAGLDASPWGDGQPIALTSSPGRAYVLLGTRDYDVQLAHDDTQTPRPYICQY